MFKEGFQRSQIGRWNHCLAGMSLDLGSRLWLASWIEMPGTLDGRSPSGGAGRKSDGGLNDYQLLNGC